MVKTNRGGYALVLSILFASPVGCSDNGGNEPPIEAGPEEVAGEDSGLEVAVEDTAVDETSDETGDDATTAETSSDDSASDVAGEAAADASDGSVGDDADSTADSADASADSAETGDTGFVCADAGECPGTDTECAKRSCVGGTCTIVFIAKGTALGSQVSGDCKTAQCDGAGGTEQVANGADLPVDGNDCTADVCSGTIPSNPARSLGSACGTGGAQVCDGAGVCVGCVTASTCPGVDDECKTRTCLSNVCGFSYAPDTKPSTTQVAGDCKKVTCDGAGATKTVTDDTDVKDDGNACTTDTCVSGVETHTNVASGVTCGTGKVCNGAGACVTCLADSDCPASTDECKVARCTSGACGFANEPDTKVSATQVAADCKKVTCDGAGATKTVNDDTDVGSDSNTCTTDSCVSGVLTHTPVTAGTACAGGKCNAAGACVGCLADSDCPASTNECQFAKCTGGTCGFGNEPSTKLSATQVAGDCKKVTCNGAGGTTTVADDADVGSDSNTCTTDACAAGVLTHTPVTVGTTCAGGKCDAAGACVACVADSDCPASTNECQFAKCTGGTCGFGNEPTTKLSATQVAGDCKKVTCDGAGSTTTVADDADIGSDSNTCTTDTCVAGVPTHTPVGEGTTCAGGKCDAAGVCQACLTAADCPASGSECRTATCTANVCGFANEPATKLVSAQTAGDCKQVYCDGAGSTRLVTDDADLPVDANPCTDDVCTSGVATNPPKGSGTSCGGSGLCNGAGVCVGCVLDSDCPASGSECKTAKCNAGTCGFANVAVGTVVTAQSVGDCKENQCDGAGNVIAVAFDADKPVDSNPCTDDVCSSGIPSNPLRTEGSSCTGGGVCTAAGSCVQCLTGANCAGSDTECAVRTCVSNLCDVSYTASGFATTAQTAGDCKQNQCDGAGNVVGVAADGDLPVDGNDCTDDVCTSGVATNPAKTAGTSCSTGVCSGTSCVQCNTAADCPGADTACATRTCLSNTCGWAYASVGTVLSASAQTAGDCKEKQCGALGAIVSVNTDTDVPVDGNDCTADVCTAGVPSNPASAEGTLCSSSGGTMCNGGGTCVPFRFSVVRVGTGAAVTNTAAVFVETRGIDGAVVSTVNLPQDTAGGGQPLSLTTSSTSEGALARSGDKRFLTLGGYAVAAGGTTTGVARVIGRINAAAVADTTTSIPSASITGIRGVASVDGTAFWAVGSSGGVRYVNFGAATDLQVSSTLTNIRTAQIVDGVLHGSAGSGTFVNVFSYTPAQPTASGAVATSFAGMPTATGPSPYGFLLLDLNPAVAGNDTLYVADDRVTGSGGGLQKWTYNGTTWTLATTFNTGLTAGLRGVTGVFVGGAVQLIAVSADTLPKIVSLLDNGTSTSFTVLATAATNTVFRGVSLPAR